MINILKSLIKKTSIFKYLIKKIELKDEKVQLRLQCLADEIRMLKKVDKKDIIKVVFVCHSPSAWSSLESLYKELNERTNFEVVVIAVPFKHGTFNNDDFNDFGMANYLKRKNIHFKYGYNEDKKTWLELQHLAPDYIFFQTPYDFQFPYKYSAEYVSLFSKICYIPYYGTLIYAGKVDEGTHPLKYFKYVSYYFVSHEHEKLVISEKFRGILQPNQIINSGSPKTDYLSLTSIPENNEWTQGLNPQYARIIWTTRWVSDGTCHFFDYKDYFLDFADNNPKIDLLFRPHPLSFQNFIKTGELSKEEYNDLISRFKRTINAKIDFSEEYQNSFLTADILVSDMSSILYEFLLTGKPIIYTHRISQFNDFGKHISKGFYWVHNQHELDETLRMLLRSEDPLKSIRKKIIQDITNDYLGLASKKIIQTLEKDYNSN